METRLSNFSYANFCSKEMGFPKILRRPSVSSPLYLGGYKLVVLRLKHFRRLYAELRKQTSQNTGMLLSEYIIEGVHACLYEILFPM